jgi:Domain of unknown function (DUF4382)
MSISKDEASIRRIWQPLLVLGCLLAVAIAVVACSSGSSVNTTSAMAKVNLTVSDPATCASPAGPFQGVWVTITDVQVSTSSTAGAMDSSWVDLTKNSTKLPMQVNLLNLPSQGCFLASLGDNLELQAGTYQQIRIILADNGAITGTTSNACSSAGSANCVEVNNQFYPLQLSSEDKTGIKIPSGQIAGGNFTIAAGQTKDLNLDFLTCQSIVKEGNGQYRLKPVLHAGEVSTTSSSVNGTVLDGVTGNPVSGSVMVALEQPDPYMPGVDRVVQSTNAAADGTFVFCPLSAGTYDIVIVGTAADGTTVYQPTIITAISPGDAIGNVKLNPPTAAATSAANIKGIVTTQTGTMTAVAENANVSALEKVGSTWYTIPLTPTATQSMAVLPVLTAASTATLTCPTNTDCASYAIEVSSGAPYVGAWSTGGVTLAAPMSPLAAYQVDAEVFPYSACSTADAQSALLTLGTAPYDVTPYNIDLTATPLALSGCQ